LGVRLNRLKISLKTTFLKPDVIYEIAYKKTAFNLLSGAENNDIFTLSFIAWLIARLEKNSL